MADTCEIEAQGGDVRHFQTISKTSGATSYEVNSTCDIRIRGHAAFQCDS